MSFEPVDVYVRDESEQPVQGVLVKVYNQAGSVFFTQGDTDVDGKASFLLETLNYTMRFYKLHTGFSQPQQFEVLAAPATNQFDVVAELFEPPTSTSNRLCKCSGFFLDGQGDPKENMAIHFMPAFDCFLLEDDAMPINSFKIFTDVDGFACVELVRGAEYLVFVEALQGESARIQVPDQSNANLPDMLLPRVGKAILSPTAPYNLVVGGELEVTPTVLLRSEVPLDGTAVQHVLWSVADGSVSSVTVGADTLTIRGISAGTTQLLAERTNTSAIRIPDDPIEGVPVDIVVT